MKYKNIERNHVIFPGRKGKLDEFLRQEYKGMQHKGGNAYSSNSEDALTWSCFDVLRSFPGLQQAAALDEMLEDSYEGDSPLSFVDRNIGDSDIKIHVGKTYEGDSSKESTEVDASLEAPGVLVFIEAKLYSSVSAANPPEKPHDQIARKLRVGLDVAQSEGREFFFIFLDIAPRDKMKRRKGKEIALQEGKGKDYKWKWRSAWIFNYYKNGANNSLRPLREALEGIEYSCKVEDVARNMGWLTWADLYKCVMRAVVSVM